MNNVRPVVSFIAFAGLVLISLSGTAAAQHGKTAHARISAAQANAVALKKYPGKIVGKTALENEEGVWQYGVMVQSGKTLREVMVNARTGKIDSVEVTTKEKEAKEKAADEANARKSGKAHK